METTPALPAEPGPKPRHVPSGRRRGGSLTAAAGLAGGGGLLLLLSAERIQGIGLLAAGVGLILLAAAVVILAQTNAQAARRLARDRARVAALVNILDTLHGGKSLGPALEAVFRQIAACFSADRAGLWLPRPDAPDEQRLVEGIGIEGLEATLLAAAPPRTQTLDAAFTVEVAPSGSEAHQDEHRIQCAGVQLQLSPSECGYLILSRKSIPLDVEELSLLAALGRDLASALRLVRQSQEASRQAERDPLTGLASHRAALRRLDLEIGRAREGGHAVAVLLLDLDNFSLYNQTYGSSAGDELLRRSAQILKRTIRDSDVVARFGGDEFLVIQPGADRQAASRAAERITAALGKERLVCADSDRLPFSFSAGVAAIPEDGEKPNDLIAAAFSRVNRSRTEGGSRVSAGSGADYRAILGNSPSFDLFQALLVAIDNKDGYTLHHSEEVTEYSLSIARQMQLPEETLRTIQTAGILHDVGKIGVPDSILRKPGRLTPEERQTMEQHPAFGALLVGALPDMETVIHGVRYHHERWDGTGYPDRLAGEDIPLIGRIMSVADTFSAITTTRPYRKGMSEEMALEEIRRGLGTQFDPKIGQLFIDLRLSTVDARKKKREPASAVDAGSGRPNGERRRRGVGAAAG